MKLARLKLFFTKEKIFVITISLFVTLGLVAGLCAFFGHAIVPDWRAVKEKTDWGVFRVDQVFTDYYKGTEFSPVKQMMGMAFICGIAAVAVSLWMLVWMAGKMRQVKIKNDTYVTNGELFLMIMGCILITSLVITAVIAQGKMNDRSWWLEQLQNPAFKGGLYPEL